MKAQRKISVLTGPKWTKKRTKSAAREKGFKILLMVRSKKKKTQDTRPTQTWRYFHNILPKKKKKQKYWSDTCWWSWHVPCFFMTVRKQIGVKPSDWYLDEQKSQKNILKDNGTLVSEYISVSYIDGYITELLFVGFITMVELALLGRWSYSVSRSRWEL